MPDPTTRYSDIGNFVTGEDGWWFGKDANHPGLQQRLSELGGDVEIRDTDANKSNYDPVDGAKYLATDTGIVYLGDGASWIQYWDLSGGGETTSTHSSLSVTNWNWVDVTNEGYDGTGSKDLADVYTTYGSNTIYILPEGTYRISAGIVDTAAFDYVGFIGAPEATLDVVDNSADQVFLFGGTNVDSKRVILKNLTVDIAGTDPNGFDIDRSIAYGTITDSAIVENIDLVGARHRYQDIDGDGTLETLGNLSTFLIRPNAVGSYVYVRGLRMPDGGTWESGAGGTSGHAIGTLSGGTESIGTTIYENCYFANFVNQGWYVKNTTGRWILRGCVAENNGNADYRIGDGDTIISCKSIQDNGSNQAYPNGVGLSLEDASHANVNGLEIVATDTGQDPVRVDGDARSATIQNVYLDMDSGVTCDFGGATDGEQILLENWLVEDSGVSGQFAPLRITRPDVTLRNCEIRATNRYAIKLHADSLTIDDCFIETGNDHILIGEDTGVTYDDLTLTNTTFSGGGSGDGGLYLYASDTVNRINVSECDWTGVTSPRADVNGTVGEWRTSANRNFGPAELGTASMSSLEIPKGTTVAPYANTGEYVLLATASQGGGTTSITATTYTTIEGADQNSRILSPAVTAGEYANISSIWVSFIVRLVNNTAGETTYCRLYDAENATTLTGTEISVTGTTPDQIHSPRVQHSPGQRWLTQGRVSAGTGTYEANPLVLIWGEIA